MRRLSQVILDHGVHELCEIQHVGGLQLSITIVLSEIIIVIIVGLGNCVGPDRKCTLRCAMFSQLLLVQTFAGV